ncbi:GxxExxY protein [Polaribacter sp. IC073]|uniref:GxxExxY protein n=1 Tax=Polaribacter sp. IC073 TaxID=2508540 RepID=UPI0011BE597B|nr:GxxExxY protein [Polaribacter sp. IC073]TXD45748.1 GxxExxY protein [Polaribacter sp. IC073]
MEKNSESNYQFGEITNKIIQAFYQVYNEIGFGFEKEVYINSLDLAFKNLNLNSEKNREIEILFNNEKVGVYNANLIVEEKILVQVFCVENFFENLEQKVYNELKLSKYNIALILNFGIKPEFKRKQI